jgi:2-polyprenyl-6-methoxyphenol hydroxylase-like FAD-dependent oxidoreductase
MIKRVRVASGAVTRRWRPGPSAPVDPQPWAWGEPCAGCSSWTTNLYELPPLRMFTCGNVVLAGDAAHAMAPDLGQGACQALEGAVVLAKVIDSGDGMGVYDRQRRLRTQMIARRAHQIGLAAQWASPVAVSPRNTALRLLPPSSFARSLAPVLDWAA